MSTYICALTDAVDAPQEVAFSSGICAMPELVAGTDHWHGQMEAAAFSELLEAALTRLYRSREWDAYVTSGQRDADVSRLKETGFLVGRRGDVSSMESSLLGARAVADYALAHGVPVSWG